MIRELVPEAKRLIGFDIECNEVTTAQEAVSEWLREIGIIHPCLRY